MRVVAGLIVVVALAVAGFIGWRAWSWSQQQPVAAVASVAPEAPVATDTPNALASPSPEATSSDVSLASAAPSPSATPTIPAQPTGLPVAWTQPYERTAGGKEADLVVRTGDINNLGYGWPAHFTPFSGESTPAHPYPCQPRYGEPSGTDRIMVGSAVTAQDFANGGGDGYAGCSTRPDNLPQPIVLTMGTLPQHVHAVLVQMFLDDFQAPVWKSHFQVSLNGTRITTFEDTINALEQTGPVGKLVTLRLLPEYLPILKSGTVDLMIDDPTTHKLDGYAVDFVRVLVNPHAFPYAVVIHCTVIDADTQKPIGSASLASAQVDGTTGANGKATLRNVPAGMVSVSASAQGYDSAVQLLDLPVGTVGEAAFALHKHRESVADLKRAIARTGSAAIYGIHFDTASATLRPESIAALNEVLELIKSDALTRWAIEGHTDNQGGADYNLGLSDARAKSVVDWLAAHGIARERLQGKGYGLTRPVADNATAAGRALNRRVEVAPLR